MKPDHARRPFSAISVAAVLLSLALGLSACGSKKHSSSSSVQPDQTTENTTATTTATSMTTPTSAATPTSVAATTTKSHLTAVRTSAQGNGDAVAFEFDGGVPGYAVKTTISPVAAGDGTKATVSGTTAYLVTFATASDVELSGGLKTYYDGSKDITPTGAKLVTQIKQVSDSEGVLTWVVGVNGTSTLNVSTVASPAQVVLDIS